MLKWKAGADLPLWLELILLAIIFDHVAWSYFWKTKQKNRHFWSDILFASMISCRTVLALIYWEDSA